MTMHPPISLMPRTRSSVFLLPLTFCCVGLLSVQASAYQQNQSPFGRSGKQGITCVQCHSGATPPTVNVTGLTNLVQGGETLITVTVTGTRSAAGFDAATDGAGIFTTNGNTDVVVNNTAFDNEIAHFHRKSYQGGNSTSWSFKLTNLVAGTHTFFVAGNDVNANGNTQGDGAFPTSFQFDVASLCGNNQLDTGEDCDVVVPTTSTCVTEGFGGGAIGCKANCTFDVSACDPCGNDVVNNGEECDGTAFGGKTCTDFNLVDGTLQCNACSIDTSQCLTCGNGVVDNGEECDGNAFSGDSCQAHQFASGTLSCTACVVSTENCSDCGDGLVDAGEACDDGNLVNGDGCSSVCAFEAGFDCGSDAGTTVCQSDGGPVPLDAGAPDAGQPDAGQPDAGQPDAGHSSTGSPDAGALDAGVAQDAGSGPNVDAGVVVVADAGATPVATDAGNAPTVDSGAGADTDSGTLATEDAGAGSSLNGGDDNPPDPADEGCSSVRVSAQGLPTTSMFAFCLLLAIGQRRRRRR